MAVIKSKGAKVVITGFRCESNNVVFHACDHRVETADGNTLADLAKLSRDDLGDLATAINAAREEWERQEGKK